MPDEPHDCVAATEVMDEPRTIAEQVYPKNGGELFFGFVSPVGTNEQRVVDEFTRELRGRSYDVKVIRLSDLLAAYADPNQLPADPEFARIRSRQQAGNDLRRRRGNDVVARIGCAVVASKRAQGQPEGAERRSDRRAYLFRSLKHPEEASLLRTIYGRGFYLVATHASYEERVSNLVGRGMTREEAIDLMTVDDKESDESGQNTREAFELADLYVTSSDHLAANVQRYIDLLFGALYITPTRDEYGMFMAASASQRSGDLARQVGAAICAKSGEVLSMGCNEVPRALGGAYWPGDVPDVRDCMLGMDPNDKEKAERRGRFRDTLGALGAELTDEQFDKAWAASGLKDITEFQRAIHAEMDAILTAARHGISVAQGSLFSTTFPCHNCARHIVGAGITRVIYIEPYAKSEAYSLHDDSILCLAIPSPETPKPQTPEPVLFEPFEGVAPRRYSDLFSMRLPTGRRIDRKSGDGRTLPQNLADLSTPRLRLSEFSYLEREQVAIQPIQQLGLSVD